MTIQDKDILLLAEKIEKGLKEFYVGLGRREDYLAERKWYTPTEMLAQIGAVLARSSSDPGTQAAGLIIFGALRVFGIKGSIQLILKWRKLHGNTNGKAKGSKDAVPGV